MMIVLASASTSVWAPLAYFIGPGCIATGYFYWWLSKVVSGTGLKILRTAWPLLGVLVVANQSSVPGLVIPIVVAAAAVGTGNLAVGLQPRIYPMPVWAGSLISLIVPLLAVTGAFIYVIGSPTVGDVATSSGLGFTVASTALFAAHGIGSAIAAFGTDRVIAR
jgi:hypothetical protein